MELTTNTSICPRTTQPVPATKASSLKIGRPGNYPEATENSPKLDGANVARSALALLDFSATALSEAPAQRANDALQTANQVKRQMMGQGDAILQIHANGLQHQPMRIAA